MKIEILAFGITKDIIGSKSILFEINTNTTLAELKTLLCIEYIKLKELKSLVIAVNEEYGQQDLIIKKGDTIALIPPVAGG